MLLSEVLSFRYFLQRVFGVGFFKLGHVGLTVATGALVANTLGPEQYGKYAFAIAGAMLVLQPIQMTVNTLVIRETAKCYAKGLYENIKGLYSSAALIGLCAVFLLPIFGITLSNIFLANKLSFDAEAFFFASVLCPFLALAQMPGAILQGFKRVQLGVAADFLIIAIWLCLVLSLMFTNYQFTPSSIMLLHGVSATAILIAGCFAIRYVVPPVVWLSKTVVSWQLWRNSFPPLFISTALYIFNSQIDIFLLGLYVEPDDVGSYRVASQLALVMGAPLIVTNSLIAPYVSEFFATNNRPSLYSALRNSTIFNIVSCSFLLFFLVLSLEDILRLLYGIDFLTALFPCLILSASQMINVFFGPVQMLLNMSGRERIVARTMPYAIIINVILNIVLIPWFGSIGAAVSSLISLSLWNFLLHRYLRRELLIECSFFILLPKFR